ncbi:MAG TPA: RNA polymerase sigma-70 factor [Acidimicrobiia bacterium]|nr:RNA polymerase sigma-70 factor [Acidimicrobiia bacterium]
MSDGLALFEEHRPRLQRLAYGMLGSVMDAEDVVQDVFLRWSAVDVTTVDSPAAYLTTMSTRTAINVLNSARRKRETYVGPWLPEPVVTVLEPDPGDVVADADQFSLAMLTAMERLNPVERAVLILRDVFDLDYHEIADIVEKSPANCRQLAVRAREHVGDADRRVALDPSEARRLLDEYVAAVASDDVERLARVFAEDVVLWADGGGKVRAARHPLHGAHRVARHLIGVRPQTPPGTRTRAVWVNGDPGIMGVVDGRPVGVLAFEVADGRIVGVRAMLDPEKLPSLG